jgi:hypothetical protein
MTPPFTEIVKKTNGTPAATILLLGNESDMLFFAQVHKHGT